MKYIEKYKSMGILSENAAFEYLLSTLKDTIRTYDFFVAWVVILSIHFQRKKLTQTSKSDRHFDFAIDTGSKVYLMEVNYYGGGGSKLKSVAGEFNRLFNLVKDDNTGFIWITDGEGWQTAKRPLSETFNTTDYVMNINMIEQGLLEEIVTKGL